MTHLVVERLHAEIDGRPVLRNVSFEVPSGGLTVLLGPSGGGKTTLLRTLAGLHPATSGRVLVDGVDITGEPAERRGLVLLHQESTLFPHLDVGHNIAFAPRLRNEPRPGDVVPDLLRLVGLEGLATRRIDQLSGGERQRVALARALAARPRVLLLDEPYSALDRSLRLELRDDVRRILHEEGVTAVHVTHDHEEAFAMADELLVLRGGRLEDRGPPDRVFREPASLEAARVLGRRNLFPYEPHRDGLRTPIGLLPGHAAASGHLLVREEEVDVILDGTGDATIDDVRFAGTRTAYVVRRGEARVHVEAPHAAPLRRGDRVRLALARVRPLLWREDTTQTP